MAYIIPTFVLVMLIAVSAACILRGLYLAINDKNGLTLQVLGLLVLAVFVAELFDRGVI